MSGKAESGLRPNGKFRGDHQECIDYVKRKVEIAFRKTRPDIVLIENYSFGSKGSALSVLHELGGVVKDMLWRHEAVWTVISPQTLKVAATGKAGASKDEMLAAARLMWHECPEHNVADAFHLAQYAIEKYDNLCEAA